MSAPEPPMPEGGFAKNRSALAGLGEAILDVLSDHTTDAEWGACLQAPYERAAAVGDVPLSIALLKAGARGSHLHPAVRGGHDDLVKELLRLGASATSKDEHGDAPVHIAASLGRGEIAKTLMIEGVDEFEVDAKGRTPAHLACWNGNVATVEVLMDGTQGNWRSGARHRLGKTKVGFTPYDLAARANHIAVMEMLRTRWPGEEASSLTDGAVLRRAAEEDNVPMIDFLVGEAGIDVDFRTEPGLSPLHSAALKGASKAMTALVKHGANASALDEEGFTPLHHAASAGHTAAVDMLCTAAGVDINLRVNQSLSYPPEYDTWSALDFAAIAGNVDAFKALVRHGADWKALSGAGLTVLNTAAASDNTELIDVLIELGAPVDGPGGDETPLYTATGAYSPDAVRALIRHGANVHHKPQGNSSLYAGSPLDDALMWGHHGAEVVNLLLENGADLNKFELTQGMSALHFMFLHSGTDDVLEALLRAGAHVSEPDYDGDYLLHQAVDAFDGAKAVELLVEAGAEVNALSPRGLTPLQMACSKADGPAVVALLRHGAAIDVVDGGGNTPLHLAAVAEVTMTNSWLFREKASTSSVAALLEADADYTATNANGHTAHDRVRLELADRDDYREGVKPVFKLFERAPSERAWRHRSLWVLCRAYPERVRVGREASRAKMPRIDEGGAADSEDDGDEAGGSMDGEGAGDFSRVAARLLGLYEEGIFRTVIGFL